MNPTNSYQHFFFSLSKTLVYGSFLPSCSLSPNLRAHLLFQTVSSFTVISDHKVRVTVLCFNLSDGTLTFKCLPGKAVVLYAEVCIVWKYCISRDSECIFLMNNNAAVLEKTFRSSSVQPSLCSAMLPQQERNEHQVCPGGCSLQFVSADFHITHWTSSVVHLRHT